MAGLISWGEAPLWCRQLRSARWLMVAQVSGAVLVVPLAPPDSGDPTRCRPIGCYVAAARLAARYLSEPGGDGPVARNCSG